MRRSNWTAEMDRALLAAVERGEVFAEIAPRIGVTRNAAIGRYHRITGMIFPSDITRVRLSKEAKKARRAELQARWIELGASYERIVRSPARRNTWIKAERANGHTLETLGAIVGITGERIRQICEA